MANVSVRDLRNKGGRVLKRVAKGESVTVTLDGEPVAELRPIRRAGRSAESPLTHWRNLPPVDAASLRADLDRVLDTSTVILLPRLENPALLPEEPLITAMTLAELSVGPLVAADKRERAARQAHLQQAEADFGALPFDAMIAAIAVANNLPLYTCNPGDFAGIDGLVVVPVPLPRLR